MCFVISSEANYLLCSVQYRDAVKYCTNTPQNEGMGCFRHGSVEPVVFLLSQNAMMYDQRNLFTVASWTRPSKDLGKNCVACSGGGGGGAGRGRGHGRGSAY